MKKHNYIDDNCLTINRYTRSIVLSSASENTKKNRWVESFDTIENRGAERTKAHASKIKLKWHNQAVCEAYKAIKDSDRLQPFTESEASVFRLAHCPQTIKQQKKEWVRKSFRTIKKLNELINLMYEYRQKNQKFYWVTVTTLQHQTGLSDRQLFYGIKKYMQHRGSRYICVAERQRETQDLHFHLIIEQKTDFDIPYEIKRVSECFERSEHGAAFNVKRVKNVGQLIGYIAKYVRKQAPNMQRLERLFDLAEKGEINPKTHKPYVYRPPYSSIYYCRTFSYSGDLGELYKLNNQKFRRKVPVRLILDSPELFRLKYQTAFYSVYEWDVKVWALACSLGQKLLKKIPENNFESE